MTNMVFGSFRHTLDEKNRVRIPAKIRDAFNSQLFLMPGRTECLYLVLAEDVENFTQKFMSADKFSDDDLNDVFTAYSASTYDLREDPQGRILISDAIKSIAGIQKEIVFVAKGSFVEIWPAEVYDRKFGALNPTRISNMLAQLKNRGN